jgi:hypothetical protein
MSACGTRTPTFRWSSVPILLIHRNGQKLGRRSLNRRRLTGSILLVNLYDYVESLEDNGERPQYGATFRVVPYEMWSVHNNLAISNMDWEEFADNAAGDGVFRGFE